MTPLPLAIGLMSGTSLDGIDAALLRTDGVRVGERVGFVSLPYATAFRARLRAQLGRAEVEPAVVRELTELHAEAVRALLLQAGVQAEEVRVVGFHGHTTLHKPREGVTRQSGDGALLAKLTGIDVVHDFRSADVAAGGEGAPLVPLYHAALAQGLPQPLAMLNIGGVANVTWVDGDKVHAFDTGPGVALMDDAMLHFTGRAYDEDGALARSGAPDEALLAQWLAHGYFHRRGPKSLDRDAFEVSQAKSLPAADALATLTHFTARAVVLSLPHLPAAPKAWYVCGGGRKNRYLMELLAQKLPAVQPMEVLGLDGCAIEAEAFAFLAMRSLTGLPLSVPETTGARSAVTGGVLYPRLPSP